MSILIWIVVAVFVVMIVQRSIGRSRAAVAGHNRCSYCRTRLKLNADKTGYADYCKKCGRQQPWAQTA